MKRRRLSRHHCIPRRLNGSGHPDNIKGLHYKKHEALHYLTDKNYKAVMPIEQMQELFKLVSSPIIGEVKDEIDNILKLAEEIGLDAYNPKCLK